MFLRPEWMLRLYPRSWQARYAEEMAAVIQLHRVTLALFFLSTLVAAIFVWRSEISQSILRITLIPLALVSQGMLGVVIQEIEWAVSVWRYNQAQVQQLAILADRTLWMGGDWHTGFLVGVIVMSFFGILSLRSLIVSLPALKNQTGSISRT